MMIPIELNDTREWFTKSKRQPKWLITFLLIKLTRKKTELSKHSF